MPVVFAQPQPFSPTISSEAGAAEQFTRFAPILQRQQEAVAEQYARNFATSASLASANADRGQRGAEFAAGQDFRRQALQVQAGQDAAQMQLKANMALQAEQSQMAEMRERARLQTEVNQAELSHREKVEMNRLQMALGAVQNNPDLTAQEKNDLALQLQTKIDPYQQRMSRARVQQEELQNQQIQKQLATQDIIAANRAEFMAGRLQALTRDVTDGEGNYLGTFTMIPGEKPHFFDKRASQQQAEEVKAKQQLAFDERVRKLTDHTEKQWDYAHKKATDMVDKELQAKMAAAENPDGGVMDYAKAFAGFDYESKVQEKMKLLGYPLGRAESVAHATRALKPAGSASGPQGGPDTGSASGPVGAPESRPLTGPDAKPNEKQAKDLSQFDKYLAPFASAPVSDRGVRPPEEAAVEKAVAKAKALYKKYGDPLNMPEADRNAYLDALEAAGQGAKKYRERTAPRTRVEPAPHAQVDPGFNPF